MPETNRFPATPHVPPPKPATKTTLFSGVSASSASSVADKQQATGPTGPTATELRMLVLLEELKTEVKLNTKLLLKLGKTNSTASMPSLPDGIKFPIRTVEQLDELEEKIQNEETASALVANLSLIGGENFESNVRRVMSHVLSHQVTLEFNWVGKGTKRPFQILKLRKVITDAVRASSPGNSNCDIEKVLKDYLRYAKDREAGRKRRMEKKPNKQNSQIPSQLNNQVRTIK